MSRKPHQKRTSTQRSKAVLSLAGLATDQGLSGARTAIDRPEVQAGKTPWGSGWSWLSSRVALRFLWVVGCVFLVIGWAGTSSSSLSARRAPAGQLVGWGGMVFPYIEPGTRFTAIAGGWYHNLALKADGTVVAWGDSSWGQSTVPEGLSDVVAVAAGGHHSLALKADGTVVAWGNNKWGESSVPENLSDVVAIAAGEAHSLALKADGTVVAWGNNKWGQSSVPEGLSDVVAIAAGERHSLALKADGTVVAWGDNGAGQSSVPLGLSDVVAIAAGGDHSLALKAIGTVVAWGDNSTGQSSVPKGLSGVVAIAGGGEHSLAVVGLPPRIQGTLSRPRGMVLSFHSQPGRQYILQYSSDLLSPTWTELPGGIVTGTGGIISITDTSLTGVPSRFYRLKRIP